MAVLDVRSVVSFYYLRNLEVLVRLGDVSAEDVVLAMGKDFSGDGYGGIFRWVEGSVDPDDGWDTIRSNLTSSGMWKRSSIIMEDIVLLAENVTDLRLLRGDSSPIASLLGYTIRNDGGQGTFYWDSTITAVDDDGGTVFAVTGVASGGWRRFYSGVVNARWFGAATSDRLQVALNVALAGEGVLYMPGEYTITTEVLATITGTANTTKAITVYGDGPGRTILHTSVNTGACLRFETITPATDFSWFLSLHDFEIVGDGDVACNGIEIEDTWMGSIKNVYFNGLSYSGVLLQAQASDVNLPKMWRIEKCRARACGRFGVEAVAGGGTLVYGLEVIQSDIQACTLGGIFAEVALFVERGNIIAYNGTAAGVYGGVFVSGIAGFSSVSISLEENGFEANEPTHIQINRAFGASITRNHFRRITSDESYFVHIGDGNALGRIESRLNTFSSALVAPFTAIKGEANLAEFVSDNDGFNIQAGDTKIDVNVATKLTSIVGGKPIYSAQTLGFAPANSLTSDTDIDRLAIGTLRVTGGVANRLQTVLSVGNAVAINCANGHNVQHTLSENTTIGAPTNPAAGVTLAFTFSQPAGMAYTIAWNGVFHLNAVAFTVTALRFSSITFRYSGSIWVETSRTLDAV